MVDLKRGDLIQVDWVDIMEDPVGDPDKARLPLRRSFGILWSKTEEALVTTSTVEEGDHISGQSGYCIYPIGCIKELSLVKRGRKKKKNGIP